MVLPDPAVLGAPRARPRAESADRVPIRVSVASHRALFSDAAHPRCDLCSALIVGLPAGSGLFVWTRDGERRFEEPPLCATCAPRIAHLAMQRYEHDEDDEG